MAIIPPRHGGNLQQAALRLGCAPEQLLDFSASLVPFAPPAAVRRCMRQALALQVYPDRSYSKLRQAIAQRHQVAADAVLPGNGAAELFTWAARDAAALELNHLPAPGFADYERALACWGGRWQREDLVLPHQEAGPQRLSTAFRSQLAGLQGPLWVTNPHNPTGQLWSRDSLLELLDRVPLLIVDEAFLPLVPDGEQQSLAALASRHPRLVVIRSLTKLFGIAGLRLGYAIAEPQRLQRWSVWRDPWPVNGLAAAAGEVLMADAAWTRRVQTWVATERPWLVGELVRRGWQVSPSSGNFLLVRRGHSLETWRQKLEQKHRILVRDCRSFEGLDERWWRLALLDRRRNRRLLRALDQVQATDRA
jgi:L-threonine-O-3-phosphate decarboxylase